MKTTKRSRSILILLYMCILLLVVWYAVLHKNNTKAVASVTYACSNNRFIDATFYEGEHKDSAPDMPPIPTGYVIIDLDGKDSMVLQQTLSGSGVRYANSDESFVFWNKGNGAIVLDHNTEKTYKGCILVSQDVSNGILKKVYVNDTYGFSLRLKDGYTPHEDYTYTALGEKNTIPGVSFTIPEHDSGGTNLGHDTAISVEEKKGSTSCTPQDFLGTQATTQTITEGDTEYLVGTTMDAAAGNRYEETVFIQKDITPCRAVRYFIHYGVFENYPTGTIKEFDKESLLREFDSIRKTLILR